MVAFHSTWYRQPPLTHHYSDAKLQELRSNYYAWYKKKFKKEYEPPVIAESGITEAMKGILKEPKVIGYIDARPVTIRHVAFKGLSKLGDRPDYTEEVHTYYASAASPLYVISWAGKRIDSFLKFENAKNYARSFLQLNGGSYA